MIGLYWHNLIDAATVSGGSWGASTPVTNVQTEELSEYARSSTDSATDTVIDADFGSASTVYAVAIVAHNLSSAATINIKLGTSAGATDVYTTGAVNAWSITKPDRMTGLHFMAFHVLPVAKSARYLRINVSDESNPDGYVQIGRVFVAGAGIKAKAVHDTYRDGLVDLSTTDRADGGAKWYVERPVYRWASFVFPSLDYSDAATLHDMLRVEKTVSEVLFIPNTDAPDYSQRWGFLADVSEMSEIEWPYPRTRSLPLKIEERI